jgi:hypothetical protein
MTNTETYNNLFAAFAMGDMPTVLGALEPWRHI